MPSNFIMIAAAVYVLSPKSSARLLFSWADKYSDDYGKDLLDTYGRCFGWLFIVFGVKFGEWVIS